MTDVRCLATRLLLLLLLLLRLLLLLLLLRQLSCVSAAVIASKQRRDGESDIVFVNRLLLPRLRCSAAREMTDDMIDEESAIEPILHVKGSGFAGNRGPRPKDSDLRILIFTACYFVLDGVTLTIRRLESHLKSRGVTIKIVSTVPDDFCKIQSKDIIKIRSIKVPFQEAGNGLAFGSGLDADAIKEIEKFDPNCVHFTVPDLVSLDGKLIF